MFEKQQRALRVNRCIIKTDVYYFVIRIEKCGHNLSFMKKGSITRNNTYICTSLTTKTHQVILPRYDGYFKFHAYKQLTVYFMHLIKFAMTSISTDATVSIDTNTLLLPLMPIQRTGRINATHFIAHLGN